MKTPDGMCRDNASQAGFTLVEVLAALSLTVLIFVFLNLAMTAVGRGIEKSQVSLGNGAALSSAAEIFSADVARIAKIRRKSNEKAQGYLFGGEPTQMVYPVAEGETSGRAGLYLVRLRVAEVQNRAQLVRERVLLVPGEPLASGDAWGDVVVLLSGDYDIDFAYRAQRSSERGWSKDWSGQKGMPEEISLTVTDRKTGRLAIPVLVQPLLVDGEVECASEGPSCTDSGSAGVKP
jgi:prepilin-type N-terminal cleavage/methylation domain-containing protein